MDTKEALVESLWLDLQRYEHYIICGARGHTEQLLIAL